MLLPLTLRRPGVVPLFLPVGTTSELEGPFSFKIGFLGTRSSKIGFTISVSLFTTFAQRLFSTTSPPSKHLCRCLLPLNLMDPSRSQCASRNPSLNAIHSRLFDLVSLFTTSAQHLVHGS
jgi:hypothetical protein